MKELFRQLDAISDIGKRLRDLSESRGTPESQRKILSDESESLLWASEELSRRLLANVMIVVGTGLEDVRGIPHDEINKYGWLQVAILFEPEEFRADKIMKQYPDAMQPAHVPDKVYAVTEYYGEGRSVVLSGKISREWMSNVGLRGVREFIGNWILGTYSNLAEEHFPQK